MDYTKLPILEATGYAILDSYDQLADPQEWLDVEYVDWKSSGDTRFAPLASAYGDMECNGFWNHTPPKTDKDGVWVAKNVAAAPILTQRAQEPGANIGRCRIIELQPNTYADAIFNLTDNPDSVMILREDKDDPSTETRIPLPAGAQVVLDTQRLYHSVWHPGTEPRYCLITSYESGPELDAWMSMRHAIDRFTSVPLDPTFAADAYAAAQAKRDARAAAIAAKGADPTFGDGTLRAGGMDEYEATAEVLSEA